LTDTGSFRFPKTDWKTHRIASELLKNGVNPSAVYQEVYENKSPGRLILLKAFLNTISFEFEGKLVFSYVTVEMLQKAGVDDAETEGLVNMPLENKGVRVSILVKIFDDQKKVSMRSKGAIDVSDIAARFNGGGHFNAAGFRLKSDKWDDINHFKEMLLKEFEPVFRQLQRVL
jgi:phosphoesterase RecJ-like protein